MARAHHQPVTVTPTWLSVRGPLTLHIIGTYAAGQAQHGGHLIIWHGSPIGTYATTERKATT
jgi:hypothetical protein